MARRPRTACPAAPASQAFRSVPQLGAVRAHTQAVTLDVICVVALQIPHLQDFLHHSTFPAAAHAALLLLPKLPPQRRQPLLPLLLSPCRRCPQLSISVCICTVRRRSFLAWQTWRLYIRSLHTRYIREYGEFGSVAGTAHIP